MPAGVCPRAGLRPDPWAGMTITIANRSLTNVRIRTLRVRLCHPNVKSGNSATMARSFASSDRQVAPAGHALDAQRDDRQVGEAHRAQLRVAGDDERLRAVVLFAAFENFGAPAQHDPAEPAPILVVAVHDEGCGGVFENVAHALERPIEPLRLLVDRDVEVAPVEHEAYRHDMRRPRTVGGRQAPYPAPIDKRALAIRQHRPIVRPFEQRANRKHHHVFDIGTKQMIVSCGGTGTRPREAQPLDIATGQFRNPAWSAPTMTGAAASLSIVDLFFHADVIVKSVLVLLLLASIWSWAVIIEKAWQLSLARRGAADGGGVAGAAEPGGGREHRRAGHRCRGRRRRCRRIGRARNIERAARADRARDAARPQR